MSRFTELNKGIMEIAKKNDLTAVEFTITTYGTLGIPMSELMEAVSNISTNMSSRDVEDIVFADEVEEEPQITHLSELYTENDEGETVIDGFSFGILDPSVGWVSEKPEHEAAIAEWLKSIGRESL